MGAIKNYFLLEERHHNQTGFRCFVVGQSKTPPPFSQLPRLHSSFCHASARVVTGCVTGWPSKKSVFTGLVTGVTGPGGYIHPSPHRPQKPPFAASTVET